MKTEIERAKESIKEYRKGYGQNQLPTDCIIQLMMGHAKSEQLIIADVVVPKGKFCKWEDHNLGVQKYGECLVCYSREEQWLQNSLQRLG